MFVGRFGYIKNLWAVLVHGPFWYAPLTIFENLLQAFALFNGQKTQVSRSTNVTAVIQDPNDNAPIFAVSTPTVTVAEDISRGSLVPGVNIEVSDPDGVSIV